MRIYLMQRYSAVALIFFMTLHMVVVHFPPGHLDFNQVLMRMESPIWKGVYVLFLLAVLIHALTGAYMVLTDIQKVALYKKGLAWGAVVLGVAAFIYGTMTILSFQAPV
jgi:succinate dehydrogenase hydrophobic anchor subunit